MPREKKGLRWYRCHIRFPTRTGAADIYFHLQGPSQMDANIQASLRAETLVPSICKHNYTTWAVLDPGYVPSKATEWVYEEDK